MPPPQKVTAAVIGAGPAGLMAAEQLGRAGFRVHVFEAMPSAGRKFLRAGVGGLNLTHAEAFERFCARFEPADVLPWLRAFTPEQLREWAAALGTETFVGSSGRVFPIQKKASPLLRAWLRSLDDLGVVIHARHRWKGWRIDGTSGGGVGDLGRELVFESPDGELHVSAGVVVLALGGGSWRKLGSDAAWMGVLEARGVPCTPLKPSNCGFNYPWSEFMGRFAGAALKAVAMTVRSQDGGFTRKGEALISRNGIEGGLVYQGSRLLRDQIALSGEATIHWDLMPDKTLEAVTSLLAQRGKDSMSNHLRKRLGFTPLKTALLRELAPASFQDPAALARAIKHLPQTLRSARPLDEAISTAGGVSLESLDPHLMLRQLPGVFCAGEMLDWEAPTGGYLLNACLAGGLVAGAGAAAYLRKNAMN